MRLFTGGEAATSIAPPSTGTDRSSKRQFLALFLITMTIMAIGLLVALTWENKPVNATATPSPVTSTT